MARRLPRNGGAPLPRSMHAQADADADANAASGAAWSSLAAWRWPLPALMAWLAAWAIWWLLRAAADAPMAGLVAGGAAAMGLGLFWPAISAWRRAMMAAGFPVAVLVTGIAMPAWAWLLPLGLLLLAYPVKAWRDAPLFPTPAQALDGLAPLLALPDGPRVLDAGCGLGHGLAALRGQWPDAQLTGHEWSWPLALAARWRIWRADIHADVQRADMWGRCWAGQDLVYVFQRPESMARAWQKACSELAPGAWLVSLEFEVQGVAPTFSLPAGPSRTLWAYQMQQGMRAPRSTLPTCGR